MPLKVNSMGRKAVRVSATTYNTAPIKGYRVVDAGSGTLVLSFSCGGDITLTNAEVLNQGYGQMAEELDSITAGTGMEVIVYIDP